MGSETTQPSAPAPRLEPVGHVGAMPVQITFEFDPRELYRATRATTGFTRVRWLFHGMGIGLPAVMILMILAGSSGRGATGVQIFFSALPWIILGAFWLALLPVGTWFGVRRVTRNDPSIRGPQVRRLDAEGFHSIGNGVRLDLPWHAFVQARETDDFLLLFYTPQQACYLPKRHLSTRQLLDARTLIETALGDRARLGSSLS